jgi:hypothetical protein
MYWESESHYISPLDIFPSITYEGKRTNDWQYVRKTTNFQSNGPVTNVQSAAMTCYQATPGGGPGVLTMNVTAGSTISYNAKASISHPGPALVWMAKAPAGTNVQQWDGSGKVFFKIHEEGAGGGAGGLSWPAQGLS